MKRIFIPLTVVALAALALAAPAVQAKGGTIIALKASTAFPGAKGKAKFQVEGQRELECSSDLRHPDPVASKREGRHEVFPQAPEGTALRAQGDRDRQAAQLHRRAPRDHALGRAPPLEVPEQSGRAVPPAHPSAGAGDEAVQIGRAGATVPRRVRRDLAALSATPAPAVGTRVPAGDGRPLRGLARGHRDRCGRGLSREPRRRVPSYLRPNCLCRRRTAPGALSR